MLTADNLLETLKKKILYADGAMGTVLQQYGHRKGCAEELNLKNPYIIQSIHKSYLDAGANILLTNTFGANRNKLKQYHLYHQLKEINQAGVRITKEVLQKARAYDCLVAGDVSELGEYMEPLGSITFDQAYEIYKEQFSALKEADLFFIETISDIKILKAAIIAAKEFNKPIMVSMTFENLRTPTGTDVKTYVKIADSLGADIIGANCSCGPKEMYEVAKIIIGNTNKPVILKPNAGLPKLVKGETVFDFNVEEFSQYAQKFAELGVNIIGGCCGTHPGFIEAIVKTTKHLTPKERNSPKTTCFCSRTRTVELDKTNDNGNSDNKITNKNNLSTLIIGERINPSGRKTFREEIKAGDLSRIRKEALSQMQEGASLLDINVGVPGTDEIVNLKKAVNIVQNAVDLPLVIDTSNKDALIDALKQCEGKPLINSVNGNIDSLNSILPLAKRFGAGVIALCLDKEGLPETVERRIEIAKMIIAAAETLKIPKEDIIIDCLTLTIATNPKSENILLESIRQVKKLGYKTVLGISNISFGLPNRSEINQKFFTKTVQAGLDLAILNPLDNVHRDDANADLSLEINRQLNQEKENLNYENLTLKKQLYTAILYGDDENILNIINRALQQLRPLEINNYLISGLEEIGKRFDKKIIFLPQVLRAAETMKIAFAKLKQEMRRVDNKQAIRIVFATVENDVHDIGKNIVIAILESYGYEIIDLGKDVPLKTIIDAARKEHANLIALSALMTTTAPEMNKLIKELQKQGLSIPVIIGGAVVTEDYALDIGAAYSHDALSAVKTIKEVLSSKEGSANKDSVNCEPYKKQKQADLERVASYGDECKKC